MTTRREAKERTRQRLLEALLEILHEAGPLALTTGRIAERAGVAQPTFYVHFTDLDRAIEIAADEVGARLLAILHAQRAVLDGDGAARTPGGRIRATYTATLEAFAADRRTSELFLRHRRDTASHFGPRFRALLASGRDELTNALARANVASPDVTSGLILGMFIAAVEGTLDGRYADRAACVDRLVVTTRALLKVDDGATKAVTR
jgi:AcrR family transcriptional regulator